MSQATQSNQQETLLPKDAVSAVQVMTQITRQMLEFVLEESTLLKNKDAATLTRIQKGKELRTFGYANAANEFKSRMAEFKDLDEALIGKLEALTIELGKATRANQTSIEAMAPKKPLNENITNNLFLLQGEQAAEAAE